MDTILYSKIKKINAEIDSIKNVVYGEDEKVLTLTPIQISNLNFVDGATQYVKNNNYETFYIPVNYGDTYTWQMTKSTGTPYVRITFTAQIPAIGIAAEQIAPQIGVTSTYTFSYTPEENGYIAISLWKNGIPISDQVVKKIKANYGLLGMLSVIKGLSPIVITGLNASEYTDGNYEANYRYCIKYFPVKESCLYEITLSSSDGSSEYRMVYSSAEPAAGGAYNHIRHFSISGPPYEFSIKTTYKAKANGYVAIAWYSEGGQTCDLEVIENSPGKLDLLQEKITEVKESIAGFANNTDSIKTLFLHGDALQEVDNYCEMKQWTVVPYKKTLVTVHCPKNVGVWFYLRVDPYNTNDDIETNPILNDETYMMNDGYSLYKIRFAYIVNNQGTITISQAVPTTDAIEMISKGLLSITYKDSDVIANNSDIEKMIWAYIGNKPVMSHISDTHGDALRYENFMKISEHYNVVCAINSGDVVNVSPSDGFKYFTGAVDKYPHVSTLVCMGNHDAYSTDANSYNNFYKKFDDAYDYELSSAKTYYYKDYDDVNLRFIVLNIYEPRHIGYQCCITQTQIEWFISALSSTPAGYGVFVVAHCSEKLIAKNNTYSDFYSKDAPTDWTTRFPNITGDPISTIVDAFISGTSITGSYTQTIQDTSDPEESVEDTVSYSADFTSKNTGAEFIAYINGHVHCDMVGYLSSTTNPQLSLNVTHGAGGEYYSTQDDLPRGDGRGSVQDAFNLYAVDRTAKKVIICRIGSNTTFDITDRKIMAIPYATT